MIVAEEERSEAEHEARMWIGAYTGKWGGGFTAMDTKAVGAVRQRWRASQHVAQGKGTYCHVIGFQ